MSRPVNSCWRSRTFLVSTTFVITCARSSSKRTSRRIRKAAGLRDLSTCGNAEWSVPALAVPASPRWGYTLHRAYEILAPKLRLEEGGWLPREPTGRTGRLVESRSPTSKRSSMTFAPQRRVQARCSAVEA